MLEMLTGGGLVFLGVLLGAAIAKSEKDSDKK